jgi:hypothetical protein
MTIQKWMWGITLKKSYFDLYESADIILVTLLSAWQKLQDNLLITELGLSNKETKLIHV